MLPNIPNYQRGADPADIRLTASWMSAFGGKADMAYCSANVRL